MTRDHLLSALLIAALIALVTLVDWTSPTTAIANERGTITFDRKVVYRGDELEARFTHSSWGNSPVAFAFSSGAGHPVHTRLARVVDGRARVRFRVPAEWIQVQVNAGGAEQRTVGVLARARAEAFGLDGEVPVATQLHPGQDLQR